MKFSVGTTRHNFITVFCEVRNHMRVSLHVFRRKSITPHLEAPANFLKISIRISMCSRMATFSKGRSTLTSTSSTLACGRIAPGDKVDFFGNSEGACDWQG